MSVLGHSSSIANAAVRYLGQLRGPLGRSLLCVAPPLLVRKYSWSTSYHGDGQPIHGDTCRYPFHGNRNHTNSIRFWQRLFSTNVHCKTPQEVAEYLKSDVKKVVVMAGAGISTPSGIPDFRTPGTGLYDNIQKYDLPYPEAIFDIDYFSHHPEAFFKLGEELYPSGKYRPNLVHYFVRLLYEKGLLLRHYMQNIDGLERLAGIPEEKLVEAHGTFATATCLVCRKTYKGEEIEKEIMKGEVPRCHRKLCNGVVKPDIVFFGEQLPMRFYVFGIDMPQADLLIVMGTSLEVHPFAGIAEAILPGVPRILFNMEAAGPFEESPRRNDVVFAGDLIEKVTEFCQMLGWKEELNLLMDKCETQYFESKT